MALMTDPCGGRSGGVGVRAGIGGIRSAIETFMTSYQLSTQFLGGRGGPGAVECEGVVAGFGADYKNLHVHQFAGFPSKFRKGNVKSVEPAQRLGIFQVPASNTLAG